MTDSPTLLDTSACETPTLLYTWSLKKVPFQAEPPRIGRCREYPTPPPPPPCHHINIALRSNKKSQKTRAYFWKEIDFKCVSKRLVTKWPGNNDLIKTTNKHGSAVFHIRYQVLSVLAPFFGVLFERCECWSLHRSPGPFSLLKNSAWRTKFSLPSLLLCARFQAKSAKTSIHTEVRVNNNR